MDGKIQLQEIDEWLDSAVGGAYKVEPLAQDWARISKVSEELGEAVQAFIGATSQNPRKGFSHTMEDVKMELADTAWTAILALQHFTKDSHVTAKILSDKLDSLYNRVPKK